MSKREATDYSKARGAFQKLHRDLAKANLDVVLENGFDPPMWSNLPIKIMLTVTEVDEAIDAVKGSGDDPFAEELADIWIRLSGILEGVWPGDWLVRYAGFLGIERELGPWESPESFVWPIVSHCCKAVEAWRHDHQEATRQHLELALKQTYSIAMRLGISLEDEVQAKLEKNRARAKYHGKAKSSG